MESSERLRFGIFEFHLSTQELYREGIPVRLQAQPAQVLGLLLKHAGEVVTRESLRQAIWGSETFVDFDRGLNFCVAQIRSALGDSAESPRFVRTYPKRGYQFIAPVATIEQAESPEAHAKSAPTRRTARLQLAIAVSFLVGVGLLMFWGFRAWSAHPDRAISPAVRVAVARFDNQTGNADFDGFADGLSDSVVADLTNASAGQYGVIGNAAILRVPRNQRDLIAIGSSLNVGYVILAQVRRNSSQFYVLAHLIRLPDQTHVAVTSLDCPAENSLQTQLELADRIARQFSPHLVARENSAYPASPPHASN